MHWVFVQWLKVEKYDKKVNAPMIQESLQLKNPFAVLHLKQSRFKHLIKTAWSMNTKNRF